MRIGVPKEIKVHEYRVGLTPASVAELVAHGHELFVETKAGNGIDCPDSAYAQKPSVGIFRVSIWILLFLIKFSQENPSQYKLAAFKWMPVGS